MPSVSPEADFGAKVDEWESLKHRFSSAALEPLACVACRAPDHASTNFCCSDPERFAGREGRDLFAFLGSEGPVW